MATAQSVVTKERLAQGISYKEWAEQIDRNQDKFEEAAHNWTAPVCAADAETGYILYVRRP